MTTIVPSKSPNPLRPLSLVISDGGDNPVHFAIDASGHRAQINVDRTALLDAVRSELDVLIAEKADLPEVHRAGKQLHAGDGAARARFMWGDATSMRAYALSTLALAEYLEAHPPVDEQQVEQIWNALTEVGMDDADGPTPHLVATRLATAGYRIQKVQS